MTSGLAVAMHIHRPLAQHRTAWGTGSGTTAANDATQRACCLWHCVPATTVWSAVYRSGADLRVQRQASRAFCSTGCVYNGVLPLASQSTLPLPTCARFASYSWHAIADAKADSRRLQGALRHRQPFDF